jgi:hypothetical protein
LIIVVMRVMTVATVVIGNFSVCCAHVCEFSIANRFGLHSDENWSVFWLNGKIMKDFCFLSPHESVIIDVGVIAASTDRFVGSIQINGTDGQHSIKLVGRGLIVSLSQNC